MAVQRRQNFPSQIRVDVPALRAIESAASSDFDTLFQSLVTGTTQGYVMRGFNIVMTNAIGNAATSLQVQVDPGALLHIAASQSGTMLLVPSGTDNQTLNSTTNPNVTGSFTPGAINYVTVDYVRFLDSSTNVQGYFWDPSTNSEFTEIVPSAQVMTFTLNISTTTPTPNQLPIALILTDTSNLVVNITDARWMFCSLGTGGLAPNPFFNYPWTQGRTLTSPTSTSDSVNPFAGGDKSIGSLKELLNAIMSIIKEIKGTTYWFSPSTTSTFPYIYQNAALNVLSGGTWVSPTLGHIQLHGGATLTRFGFQNQLTFASFGPSLGPDLSANTATVTENTNVAYTTAAGSPTNIGDTVTIGATTRIVTAIVQTSPTLTVEVAEPGFTNGTGLSATLTHYSSFNLTTDQVLYTLFPSSDTPVTYGYGNDNTNPIVPQQVQFGGVSPTTILVPSGGNYESNPLPGPDSGSILVNGQVYSYNTYSEFGGVGTFNDVSPSPVNQVNTGDFVYQLDNNGTGYYHTSAPQNVPGTFGSFSLGAERVYWLAFYDGSSNVILREGILAAGEAINVGDTLSTAILTYIGMPSSGTNYPTYSSNIRGTTFENLTSRSGALTDAIGDEQEDRSAFFYSVNVLTWNGSTVSFSADIVLHILNTKSGTITSHTIQSSAWPSGVTLANGQLFYISINRLASSENVTGTIASFLPAQTEATKDIFVVFQNINGNLVVPLHKQVIASGENKYLGGDIPFIGFTNSGGSPQQTFTYAGTTPGYLSMNDARNTPALMNLIIDGIYVGGNTGLTNSASFRYGAAGDPLAQSTGDTVITTNNGNHIMFGIGSSQVGSWNSVGLELFNHLSLGIPPVTHIGIANYASLSGAINQYGNDSEVTFSSGATSGAFNYFSAPATQAASYTIPELAHFYAQSVSKGAGSTITNLINYLGNVPTQGTNNAFMADNGSFTGNWFINQSGTTNTALGGAIYLGGVANNLVLQRVSSPINALYIGDPTEAITYGLVFQSGAQLAILEPNGNDFIFHGNIHIGGISGPYLENSSGNLRIDVTSFLNIANGIGGMTIGLNSANVTGISTNALQLGGTSFAKLASQSTNRIDIQNPSSGLSLPIVTCPENDVAIRGTVTWNGSAFVITAGSGFTIVTNNSSQFTITYSAGTFTGGSTPSVVLSGSLFVNSTATVDCLMFLASRATGAFSVQTVSSSNGSAQTPESGTNFDFVVFGSRNN